MPSRKLIFVATADPAVEAGSVIAAYLLADAALAGGLEAEVRLTADAVLVADPGYVATVPESARLRERLDWAVARGLVTTVCPGSADDRGIPAEQLAGIGARPQPLADVLADGGGRRPVLVPL